MAQYYLEKIWFAFIKYFNLFSAQETHILLFYLFHPPQQCFSYWFHFHIHISLLVDNHSHIFPIAMLMSQVKINVSDLLPCLLNLHVYACPGISEHVGIETIVINHLPVVSIVQLIYGLYDVDLNFEFYFSNVKYIFFNLLKSEVFYC